VCARGKIGSLSQAFYTSSFDCLQCAKTEGELQVITPNLKAGVEGLGMRVGRYLAYCIFSHQNVPGRQVSVHKGLLSKVAHPGGDLPAVAQQGVRCLLVNLFTRPGGAGT